MSVIVKPMNNKTYIIGNANPDHPCARYLVTSWGYDNNISQNMQFTYASLYRQILRFSDKVSANMFYNDWIDIKGKCYIQNPNKFSHIYNLDYDLNFRKLRYTNIASNNIDIWLIQNIGPKYENWYISYNSVILKSNHKSIYRTLSFKNETDLMLFKITYG